MSAPAQSVVDDRFSAWVCGSRPLMKARADTLAGLPIGVKDVVATDAFPTQCGTRLPQSVISQLLGTAEAECISVLTQAGANIAGKTVTAE